AGDGPAMGGGPAALDGGEDTAAIRGASPSPRRRRPRQGLAALLVGMVARPLSGGSSRPDGRLAVWRRLDPAALDPAALDGDPAARWGSMKSSPGASTRLAAPSGLDRPAGGERQGRGVFSRFRLSGLPYPRPPDFWRGSRGHLKAWHGCIVGH